MQQVFVAGHADHQVWFPPVQTNSLEPNLTKFPTNQLAVRKAISLAIDRTALSQQAEGGLEPPVSNASGLTLPIFQQFLSPSVASLTLPAHSNIAAAKQVLEQAGYVMGSDGFFRTKSGQKLSLDITNPSSFADYATGDQMVAGWLRKAGIDATFVGQSVTAWSSDIATGNFQLTAHWSQTSVSPYQLYNDWLNSAQATNNAAGNFERLKDPTVDAALNKLAADNTAAAQQADLAPIEQYVAQNLPIIPTVYGVVFDEYNTSKFTGWPSAEQPVRVGQPEHAHQRGRDLAPATDQLGPAPPQGARFPCPLTRGAGACAASCLLNFFERHRLGEPHEWDVTRRSSRRTPVPAGLPLGCRDLGVSDRGSGRGGRPRPVDLGHLQPHPGQRARRRHGRHRVRLVSPPGG